MRSANTKSQILIFDLDGTLVEHIIDFTVIKSFLIDFLDTLGIPRRTFDPRKNTLDLIENAERYILSTGSTLEKAQLLRKKILASVEVFEWDAARKTKILPQVKTTLDELKGEYQLVVLSNVKTDIAHYTLERFGLTSNFFQINGRDSVPNMKPDRRGLEHILTSLSVKPSDAVMIGDSTIDIIPANQLGVLPIGVTTGISSYKDLKKAGAKYIISSMSELPKTLAQEFPKP